MKYVGAHVSISGGIYNAPKNAKKIGAKAFGMFTKNQRRWNAKPLECKDIEKFHEELKNSGIMTDKILVHDSYLINLANPEKEQRNKSIMAFIDEINRVKKIGLKYLNFHPGSTVGKVEDGKGLDLIVEAMNIALKKTEDVVLVIENTAGQGNDLGYTFEHIKYLIKNSSNENRVGVCLDTAHAYGAGYDVKNNLDKTLIEFDEIIGIEFLKGMHINDTKVELGSRKDRHEDVGRGKLGWKTFKNIMNDSRLENIPLIMETSNKDEWAQDIKKLYDFVK